MQRNALQYNMLYLSELYAILYSFKNNYADIFFIFSVTGRFVLFRKNLS
jgi:hypothetical protein